MNRRETLSVYLRANVYGTQCMAAEALEKEALARSIIVPSLFCITLLIAFKICRALSTEDNPFQIEDGFEYVPDP